MFFLFLIQNLVMNWEAKENPLKWNPLSKSCLLKLVEPCTLIKMSSMHIYHQYIYIYIYIYIMSYIYYISYILYILYITYIHYIHIYIHTYIYIYMYIYYIVLNANRKMGLSVILKDQSI